MKNKKNKLNRLLTLRDLDIRHTDNIKVFEAPICECCGCKENLVVESNEGLVEFVKYNIANDSENMLVVVGRRNDKAIVFQEVYNTKPELQAYEIKKKNLHVIGRYLREMPCVGKVMVLDEVRHNEYKIIEK